MNNGTECLCFGLCWFFFSTYTYCKGYNVLERCQQGAKAAHNLNMAAHIMYEDSNARRNNVIYIRDKDHTAEAYQDKAMYHAMEADKAEKGLVKIVGDDIDWNEEDKKVFGLCFIFGLVVFAGTFITLIIMSSQSKSYTPGVAGGLFVGLCVLTCCFGPKVVEREEGMKARALQGKLLQNSSEENQA